MQSQLAAALLGQNSSAMHEEEEKDEHEQDEGDDVDEFIDEDDAESAKSAGKNGPANAATSRVVTLQMLLAADILQPGDGYMSIEYLGQRFIGDLLLDGKIKSQETDIVFASPSAWAIHCKRIINPDKKSGCGWASVKYKGKKLDAYKNIWYKKKKQDEDKDKTEEHSDKMDIDHGDHKNDSAPMPPLQRHVVKHNTIANRTFTHDANTLIECVPFSNLGKIQPFLVSINTNAVLVMDFHCHLTLGEVSGYLAGQWEYNGHNLTITHCFPCRYNKSEKDSAQAIEMEIQKQIEKENLLLVGWYHSHPISPAAPTLRDVDSQLEYQIRMKGATDSNYTPCIGVIISPYNMEYNTIESAIICYWVIPPPETKPNEYGRPMLMSYSVVQDSVLSPGVMDEMKRCAEFYRKDKNCINFSDRYHNSTTFLEKLKTTLSSKFPRDQNDGVLWGFIKEIIGYSGDEKIDTTALLQVPNLNIKPQISPVSSLPPLSSATSLSSNLMLTSNLANVLFSSGKYPTPSSLLGLPDPMAQSTLAANNMFLSPSLFKMQDTLNLLKPLSSSSPIPSTSKSESNKQSSKKSELKTPTLDYADLSLLNLKNKLDFGLPELNLSNLSSLSNLTNLPKPNFNVADLSISSVRTPKLDFSASDLSISSSKSSKDSYGLDATIKSFMAAQAQSMDAPSNKMPKTDYSMLDLSVTNKSSSFVDSLSFTSGMDATMATSVNKNETSTSSDQPLNLAE